MSSKKLIRLFGAIAFLAGISACDSADTYYYDYLHAAGKVYYNNAATPVSGLNVSGYNWVVSYKDGSTVGVPFDPKVSTDAVGEFSFSSTELALQSGNLAESCTDVCVDWDTRYEEVCVAWDSEDYCSDWETDSNGNEYCADWDTDTYCTDSDTQSYSYCSAWGEDCEYYYPSRNAADIKEAYSELNYYSGSTLLTTASETYTQAATALQTTSTPVGKNDTNVDYVWNQSDAFVTPFQAPSAGARKSGTLTAKQAEIVKARNANKKKRPATAPNLGRNYPAPAKLKLSKLTALQKLQVEMARKGFGATPKAAK